MPAAHPKVASLSRKAILNIFFFICGGLFVHRLHTLQQHVSQTSSLPLDWRSSPSHDPYRIKRMYEASARRPGNSTECRKALFPGSPDGTWEEQAVATNARAMARVHVTKKSRADVRILCLVYLAEKNLQIDETTRTRHRPSDSPAGVYAAVWHQLNLLLLHCDPRVHARSDACFDVAACVRRGRLSL